MTTKSTKEITVSFSDFSDGVNLSEDMNKIGERQVQDCLDAILRKNGTQKRPGSIAGDVSLATNAKGLHLFKQFGGGITRVLLSAGKLYSFPLAADTKTELFDLTGTGEGSFADYLNLLWMCNGTKNVKYDGSNAYQIGITKPSGATATANAGGTIPAGTYTVYAAYARKVGGVNVLYSMGAENLGNVIMAGGGNQTVDITFPNSSDGQVNNKIIFMADPVGGVTGLWHETNDNTTTSFSITSNANQDDTVIYGIVCLPNTVIPAFTHIYAFNKTIIGSSSNIVYQSLRHASTSYNLERFFTENTHTYPYDLLGFFHLNNHLYINTKHGIIKQPYGDFGLEWEMVTDDKFYFYDIKTVKQGFGWIIGLTNDGVKIFGFGSDGREKFFDYDITADVRPEIKKIYTSTAGFTPCGEIHDRDIRKEYHISYNDDSLSSTSNNARLVLNLNKLQLLPDKRVVAPWEKWSNGANYMASESQSTFWGLQDHTTPKLYKEILTNTIDNGIYLNDGTLGAATSYTKFSVTTRAFLKSLDSFIDWHTIRFMVKMATKMDVTGQIRDSFGLTHVKEIASGAILWSEITWDETNWDSSTLGPIKAKFKELLRGYIFYLKIEQSADDFDFNLLEMEVKGNAKTTRYQ